MSEVRMSTPEIEAELHSDEINVELGSVIHANDYTITITPMEGGYALTAERGGITQRMEIFSMTQAEAEALQAAEQGRADAEQLRVIAELARVTAEAQRAAAAAAIQAALERGDFDGKTPEKGVDYMTEEDAQEIAEMAAGKVVPYDDREIRSGLAGHEKRIGVLERGGGSGYDDTEIREEIAGHEDRIDALEQSGGYDDTEIREEIARVDGHAAQLVERMVAYGYSWNQQYWPGDFCIYEGQLWRCYREVSPGPFDEGAWYPLYVTTTIREAETLAKAAASGVSGKIDKPEDAPAVGKMLRVKAVNEDGSFVCEWADAPGGGVEDVQVNGASVVQDGTATVPLMSTSNVGVAKCGLGLKMQDLALRMDTATAANITNRAQGKVLAANLINDFTKAAFTDAKKMVMTDAEKLVACQTLGAEVKYISNDTVQITLTEDSTRIPIDTGISRYIYIVVEAKGTDVGGTYYYDTYGAEGESLFSSSVYNGLATSNRYSFIEIEKHGALASVFCGSNSGIGDTDTQLRKPTNAIFRGEIHGVVLTTSSSRPFKAGTVITAYSER